MPLLPVVLILAASVMHAGWNLLARRQRQELAFFSRMLLFALPMSGAAIAVGLSFQHSMPARAWACVVASSLICGLYFWFLGLAYGSSDFAIVYPVARALPVIMVAALDMLRGRYPTGAGWLGLMMVVGGCVLAPQASYRTFDFRRYGARDIMWIVLTAVTIAGFTMFDKIAAETMKQGPASAAIYCGLYHALSCVAYFTVLAAAGRHRIVAEEVGWRWPALGAFCTFAGYMLVLWAFQLTPKTAYLLAFRQFSIVIGVAAAFLVYRERGLAVRLPATLSIVAGLLLLVLYG